MAIGDSWLFDRWRSTYGEERPNLVSSLLNEGYKDLASDGIHQFTAAGRRLGELANTSFLTDVTNYLSDQPSIKGILLDGGGNDVVKAGLITDKPLYKMLNQRSAGGDPLNGAEVTAFIHGTLFSYFDTIINALRKRPSFPSSLLHTTIRFRTAEAKTSWVFQYRHGSSRYSSSAATTSPTFPPPARI